MTGLRSIGDKITPLKGRAFAAAPVDVRSYSQGERWLYADWSSALA